MFVCFFFVFIYRQPGNCIVHTHTHTQHALQWDKMIKHVTCWYANINLKSQINKYGVILHTKKKRPVRT